MKTEQYNGSDLTGSDFDTDRTITLSNKNITLDDGFKIVVDNFFLNRTDFTIEHKTQDSIVTFLTQQLNESKITIYYKTMVVS